MVDITFSIVIYDIERQNVEKLLKSICTLKMKKKLFIVDNSKEKTNFKNLGEEVKYIFNNKNLGYGKAHNIAMRRALELESKYHVVINPDINFLGKEIEKLINYMEENEEIGMLMPRIFYPDGRIQYLCKLLPNPFVLLIRRFLPLKYLLEKINKKYELRFTDYNEIMEVPYLSGCFMLIRTEVIKKVGMFDEQFFMYLEDTDLSRRINEKYKTVYYPYATIFHKHEKGSYKKLKLLYYHIKSTVYYFNKWGWFIDKKRKMINKKTLKILEYKK